MRDPGPATTTAARAEPPEGDTTTVRDEPTPPELDTPPPDDAYDNVSQLPDRQPPHERMAEQAVLGAALHAKAIADALDGHLQPTDFYDPRHETIWTAIQDIRSTGRIADPITLSRHLVANKTITKVGGAPYLHELYASCPNPALAVEYATDVRDAARARAVAQTGHRIALLASTATPETLAFALSEAVQELDDVVARTGARTVAAGGLRDLTWLLGGEPPTVNPPAYVRRAAGDHLFYAGRVNGIYGDPEAAKSWLAQIGVVQALAAGQRAAIVDVDHNGAILTAERLLLLGATIDQLADPDRFRYLEPEDGEDLRAAVTSLVAWSPHYVVLDSIGEMMPMLGIKSIDNDELSGALRTIATALANTGACVVTIDHLPKGQEARGSGFAIGGTAKKRAIDGAYIHADAKIAPAPGAIGRITLRIEKDRLGRLRAACTGKYIGTFVMDSTRPEYGVVTSIEQDSPVNREGVFRPTGLMESVSRFVEENDQASFNDICQAVTGKEKNIRAAIKVLTNEGFMTTLTGPRNSRLHHAISLYRESEDDQI